MFPLSAAWDGRSISGLGIVAQEKMVNKNAKWIKNKILFIIKISLKLALDILFIIKENSNVF